MSYDVQIFGTLRSHSNERCGRRRPAE